MTSTSPRIARAKKRKAKAAPPGSEEYTDAVAFYGNNMLVPWYLMASYAYYVLDESLLTDEQYDNLCKVLDEKWDTITHRHKDNIDRAALKAGTAFHMNSAGDYPAMAVGAAHRLLGK